MLGDINGDGHLDFMDYVIYEDVTDSNDSGGSPKLNSNFNLGGGAGEKTGEMDEVPCRIGESVVKCS